jgi:hypothetical protein
MSRVNTPCPLPRDNRWNGWFVADSFRQIKFLNQKDVPMRTHSLVISATLIAALVLALAGIAMAADTHDGTWKLNLAKSKVLPGPAPKSLTTTRETHGDSAKSVFDGVDANGNIFHYEYTATFDGKDCPITGSPNFDAISLNKIDVNTYEWVTKKSGKEVAHGRTVYSKDGKTRTQTEKSKDAKGQEVTSIAVYEKQ